MFSGYKKIKTSIRGRGVYTLWVADTDKKRRLGLRGVKFLPRRHGMIFIYDQPVDHSFTMKDVRIPLTLIFLDRNFNIVDVVKARPGQISITPKSKYNFVVEI